MTPTDITEGGSELDEVVDGETHAPLDTVGDQKEGHSDIIGGPGPPINEETDTGGGERAKKYHIKGTDVKIIAQRIQYYDSDGKLTTESFKDYTRNKFNKQYASLDEFTKRWNEAERKQVIINELANAGIIWEALREETGNDMDAFDLICHVVYDQPPLTRRERANQVKKRDYFTRYSESAQAVLNVLLDKYADAGVEEIESLSVLKLKPLDQLGSPMEIVKQSFGDKEGYKQAISDLEAEIYWLPPKQA